MPVVFKENIRKEYRIKSWQLQQRQSLPLEVKIKRSNLRIREWYDYWKGNVYVAFSGGKDSTVLLDLVRKLHPEVPAVFANTGLEYPEIIKFVRIIDNVMWLKPKKSFKRVIEEFGYPVISKETSLKVRQIRNCPIGSKTHTLRTTGIDSKGKMTTMGRLPKKWNFLIDAPFLISEHCCYVMKKAPMYRYEDKYNVKAFLGMMASDSRNRKMMYLRRGCNAFSGQIQSNPIAFWLEEDIWNYIKKFNLKYSSIYDMGYRRTGCIFCCFGITMENTPNRFQLMKQTHPKLYNYCMDKLGIRDVLKYCGVPYE